MFIHSYLHCRLTDILDCYGTVKMSWLMPFASTAPILSQMFRSLHGHGSRSRTGKQAEGVIPLRNLVYTTLSNIRQGCLLERYRVSIPYDSAFHSRTHLPVAFSLFTTVDCSSHRSPRWIRLFWKLGRRCIAWI